MRFYTNEHRFYCGVDLYARTMYLCILDDAGQVRPPFLLAGRAERISFLGQGFRGVQLLR